MIDMFQAVFLINLRRRPDRLAAALATIREHDWPFRAPEVFEAIDGNLVLAPAGWKSGGGAWGCRCSHVAILHRCIREGIEPVLVLEDDIALRSTFRHDCEQFFRDVPDDWECLMLGGQHHRTPRPVKPGIVRCRDCQRTHAYAIRGKFLRDLHAQWSSPKQLVHIDWTFGPMQANYRTYAPDPFLFGQTRDWSDICGRTNPAKFWQPPKGDEPVLVLRCDRETMEALRWYCIHTGYDRGDDGIDNGLRAVFASDDPTRGLRKWIGELQWECVSEEGAVLGIWHPLATVEMVRECWRGPVAEVRRLEEALPYLSCRKAPAEGEIWPFDPGETSGPGDVYAAQTAEFGD